MKADQVMQSITDALLRAKYRDNAFPFLGLQLRVNNDGSCFYLTDMHRGHDILSATVTYATKATLIALVTTEVERRLREALL